MQGRRGADAEGEDARAHLEQLPHVQQLVEVVRDLRVNPQLGQLLPARLVGNQPASRGLRFQCIGSRV